jgi:hypothetical protein
MTTLNELYSTICKQENAHPKAALFVVGDFNAGKLESVLPNLYQHVKCATRGEKKLWTTFTHTERHRNLSLTLRLANLTIIPSS